MLATVVAMLATVVRCHNYNLSSDSTDMHNYVLVNEGP